MVFPLLNLPGVPLRQIINGMESYELFDLYNCSDVASMALKPYEKANKNFQVQIDFQRHSIDIKGVRRYRCIEEYNENWREKKIQVFDGREVSVEELDNQNYNTYWPETDKFIGTMCLANNFTEKLGMGTLDQLMIGEETPAGKVLDWIEKNDLKMIDFNLIGTPEHKADDVATRIYSDEFFKRVSMNYTSLLKTSDGFQPKGISGTKTISLGKLQLEHAEWITLNHLMMFNCHSIILHSSSLTNQDIRTYLSKWRNGEFEQMMYLSLELKNQKKFDLKEITKDMIDSKKIEIAESGEQEVILPRNDGKTAEINVNATGEKLIIWIE
uniref:FBA_2 domain-containing protein n=1 Tax=Caenorhabditis tropicalis TaxID=1561998 RepID=A0A1I7UT40_9PELO